MLNILFCICLVTLILLKFIYYNFFSEGVKRNFETLISNICFAFIASFIFYTIVTKGIDIQKKIKAYAVICGILDSIISSGRQVEKKIWEGNYKNNSDQFVKACANIDLSEKDKNSNMTKAEYLKFYGSTSIKTNVKILYAYMPFLESDILHEFNNIQNSTFTRYINLLPILKDKNLKHFSTDISNFLDMIFELEKIYLKLKNKYLKGYQKKN